MVRNRAFQISVLLWVVALSAVALSGLPKPSTVQKPDVASRVLEQYLRSGEEVPTNSVVKRQIHSSNQSFEITMQLVQDDQGRRRMTLLKPLTVQGQVAVDDGKVFTTFCPDTNRFMLVPSPRLAEKDIDLRLDLVKKNYALALEQNVDIAGRMAYVVVAVPNAKKMPIRKITVDAKTSVLLQVEAIQPGGERDMLFETQAITFPKSVATADFDTTPPPSVRKITYPKPEPIHTVEQGQKLVGFEPLFFESLPFGFVVRGVEAGGTADSRFVATRITDGVVTASIYQWDADVKEIPLGRDLWGLDRVIDGIGLRILGEIGPDVRLEMLESIANERGKTFRPRGERITVPGALIQPVETRIGMPLPASPQWRSKQQP